MVVHTMPLLHRAGFQALLLCLALGMASPAFNYAQERQRREPPPNPLEQLSASLETLVEQISPAVVEIFVTGFGLAEGQDPFRASIVTPKRTTGSGVLVHPEGYIITTAHLIRGAERIRVLFTLPSEGGKTPGSIVRPPGRILDAMVLGFDLETDLAVLKINAKVIRYLKFGDSGALRKGQLVFAFGNPRLMEEGVSMGIVSSNSRQIEMDDPMIYIQTDASITPGNSGGPLVDIQGNLIGINNHQASVEIDEQGFGLAAPANIVRTVYEQIRKNGSVTRGIIGLTPQSINPLMAAALDLPQNWGVVVADVIPTSPADMAGLRAGDIVHSLDGKVMENARQFNVNVYQRRIGEQVAVEFSRAGDRRKVEIPVFERPDIPDRLARLMDRTRTSVPELGVMAADIDEETMEDLPFFRDSLGVMVAAHMPGSLSRGSLNPGDLIHAINTVPLENLAQLREDLAKRRKGDIVYLYIERQLQYRYVIVEIQ